MWNLLPTWLLEDDEALQLWQPDWGLLWHLSAGALLLDGDKSGWVPNTRLEVDASFKSEFIRSFTRSYSDWKVGSKITEIETLWRNKSLWNWISILNWQVRPMNFHFWITPKMQVSERKRWYFLTSLYLQSATFYSFYTYAIMEELANNWN